MILLRKTYKSQLLKNILTFNVCKRKFNNNIVLCPSEDVVIPKIPIAEWVYSKMERFHKYTAVECVETGKKYTYEQIRTKSENLSKALRKNWNLKSGDVVAVYLSNSPDFFVACLGILNAGLVVTTVNSFYKSDEVSRQLLDSSAKIIITQPEKINEAREACIIIKTKLPIISTKIKENDSIPYGVINFEELINTRIDFHDAPHRNPEDLAFLPYSSGTTGVPKGVEITQNNLVSTGCQIIHPVYNIVEPPTEHYQDIVTGILPMYHIYGFTLLQLNGLTTGMRVLSFSKFSPELFISALKNYRVSMMYAVPPLVLFLTNYPEVKIEHLKHLKFALCGAAPLGTLDEKRFKEKVGHPFYSVQGYGLTETTGLTSSLGHKKLLNDLEKYQGSSGPPVMNTSVKILNIDDQSALGPYESGEILVKGTQVMKGYLNKPKETEKVFLDGWFRTGDIGYYNEDGMIYITDRLKELIKVKGFQVAPAELEELIRDFPSVADAAVIGVPHPRFGEVPRAYVVKKSGKQLKAEEVDKYVSEKVAKYKQLVGGIEIVDNIPKTPSGKILRKQLRQEYEENLNK